jgi:serine/threonine-protein kinase RIM15
MGAELVRKVQDVGKAWDNHPDWYGRTWYITVLLAVATLARVVEWFEAERQFWNFEDDDEDKEAEPLTFVLKPEFDGEFSDIGGRSRDESIPKTPIAATGPGFTLADEHRSQLSRESSIGTDMRITRDQRTPQKDLSGAILFPDQRDTGRKSPSPMGTPSPQPYGPQPAPQGYEDPSTTGSEAVRMEASEHLRQKADKAKSSNILMELNLDGEHFLYINRTWMDVLG